MSFSFCLNKADLLTLCGMSLLYQTIELKQDGRLMREDERLVNAVLKMLCSGAAPGSLAFTKVARLLINVEDASLAVANAEAAAAKRDLGSSLNSKPRQKSWSRTGRLAAVATASESDLLQQQEKLRRMTMPSSVSQRPEIYRTAPSRQSFESLPSDDIAELQRQRQQGHGHYVPIGSDGGPGRSQSSSPSQARQQVPLAPAAATTHQLPTKVSAVTEWEALLGSMDGGINNVYDAIYGGPPLVETSAVENLPASNPADWSPDSWDLATFNLGNGTGAGDFGPGAPNAPQSVLSLSDESLSSGEEIAPSELGLSVGSAEYNQMIAAGCGNDMTGCENDRYQMENFENFHL
jgi:hypothetical protein